MKSKDIMETRRATRDGLEQIGVRIDVTINELAEVDFEDDDTSLVGRIKETADALVEADAVGDAEKVGVLGLRLGTYTALYVGRG